jgi:hypothetical protein
MHKDLMSCRQIRRVAKALALNSPEALSEATGGRVSEACCELILFGRETGPIRESALLVLTTTLDRLSEGKESQQ